MKTTRLLLIVLFLIMSVPVHAQPLPLTPMSIPSSLSGITAITINPDDPDRVLTGDKNNLFISDNFGRSWRNIFTTRRPREQIIDCFFMYDEVNAWYVLTNERLYKQQNTVTTELYAASDAGMYSFAQDPFDHTTLALGTFRGLFISRDGGVRWKLCEKQFAGMPVTAVSFHPNVKDRLFAEGNGAVFMINMKKMAVYETRLWNNEEPETPGNAPDENTDEDEKTMFVFSLNQDAVVYLSQGDTVYETDDYGVSWKKLTLPHDVTERVSAVNLDSSRDALLIASSQGLCAFDPGTQTVEHYVSSMPVCSSAFYEGTIRRYVVTDGTSLYAYEEKMIPQIPQLIQHGYDEVSRTLTGVFQENRALLPPVAYLQFCALKYAHLTENRLRSWERRARMRTLFPTLSFDIDKTVSNNIDVDRGSTSDPDTFLDGPDDRDFSVGISCKWDMADLIWNDTETTIEYRTRAFVEQRDEILYEVTRLYYEYIKLQTQIQLHKDDEVEGFSHLDALVRCEEIRAQLDGLTGGAMRENFVKTNSNL